MRMWNVPPSLLCRKHLLGEHVETHMFAGTILKGNSLQGYIKKGLVEVHNIKSRHEELSNEMKTREYKHNSPLPEFVSYDAGKVNMEKNLIELSSRCPECRQRIVQNNKNI